MVSNADWFPAGLAIGGKQWKPRQPVVSAHLPVIKSILPVAPGAEDEQGIGIGIGHELLPARRHHHSFAGASFDCDAAPGIVAGFLLPINDGAAVPDFE